MTTYMSTAQILEGQKRTMAADARADADPSSVTESDLRDISPEKLSSLMDAGQLAHLGIGAPRRPRRRH
jgi:hypothetical protein